MDLPEEKSMSEESIAKTIPNQCTAHSSSDPTRRCKRSAIRGGTVCATHGGSAPQVALSALIRRLEDHSQTADEVIANILRKELDGPDNCETCGRGPNSNLGFKTAKYVLSALTKAKEKEPPKATTDLPPLSKFLSPPSQANYYRLLAEGIERQEAVVKAGRLEEWQQLSAWHQEDEREALITECLGHKTPIDVTPESVESVAPGSDDDDPYDFTPSPPTFMSDLRREVEEPLTPAPEPSRPGADQFLQVTPAPKPGGFSRARDWLKDIVK
jgi:hypothetical protein